MTSALFRKLAEECANSGVYPTTLTVESRLIAVKFWGIVRRLLLSREARQK
jgi:hypothetical protein